MEKLSAFTASEMLPRLAAPKPPAIIDEPEYSVDRLAAMNLVEYELHRKRAAEALGLEVGNLDKLVKAAQASRPRGGGRGWIIFLALLGILWAVVKCEAPPIHSSSSSSPPSDAPSVSTTPTGVPASAVAGATVPSDLPSDNVGIATVFFATGRLGTCSLGSGRLYQHPRPGVPHARGGRPGAGGLRAQASGRNPLCPIEGSPLPGAGSSSDSPDPSREELMPSRLSFVLTPGAHTVTVHFSRPRSFRRHSPDQSFIECTVTVSVPTGSQTRRASRQQKDGLEQPASSERRSHRMNVRALHAGEQSVGQVM